jgi:hypothetical protein
MDFIDKSTFNVMDLDTLRREVVDKIAACGRRALDRSDRAAPARPAAAGA